MLWESSVLYHEPNVVTVPKGLILENFHTWKFYSLPPILIISWTAILEPLYNSYTVSWFFNTLCDLLRQHKTFRLTSIRSPRVNADFLLPLHQLLSVNLELSLPLSIKPRTRFIYLCVFLMADLYHTLCMTTTQARTHQLQLRCLIHHRKNHCTGKNISACAVLLDASQKDTLYIQKIMCCAASWIIGWDLVQLRII